MVYFVLLLLLSLLRALVGIDKDELTVFLVKGTPKKPSTATTPTTPAASANTSTNRSNTVPAQPTPNPIFSQTTTPPAASTPTSPWGMGGGLGSNFQQMQQNLLQNPEMMQNMLNSPVVRNLMSDPELLRTMFSSHPQMRELMERNPEISHVLNDPEILRQTFEYARNPALMREMMRTTDRAMSNIETHPEGFNLLRRMYTNVQEPMMDAGTNAAESMVNNSDNTNPFSSLFTNSQTTADSTPAPNTSPLPNPWAPQPQAQGTAANTSGGTGTGAANSGAAPNMANLFSGAGGLGGMRMPDQNHVQQMLNNPMMRQMMQNMMRNPAVMDQVKLKM